MEERKKPGRKAKKNPKCHMLALRYDDGKMAVLDYIADKYGRKDETRSEVLARCFLEFCKMKLAEKQFDDKQRLERSSVNMTYQYKHKEPEQLRAEKVEIARAVVRACGKVERQALENGFRFYPGNVSAEDPSNPIADAVRENSGAEV